MQPTGHGVLAPQSGRFAGGGNKNILCDLLRRDQIGDTAAGGGENEVRMTLDEVSKGLFGAAVHVIAKQFAV